MSDSDSPATVLCHFRVKAGSEEDLMRLCRDHDRVLRGLDLVTAEPAVVYRAHDSKGRPVLYKIFEWKSERALDAARQHPEVMDLWERMEPLCEEREGWPSMEFPHVERTVL